MATPKRKVSSTLKADTEAAKMFVGSDCSLCKVPDDYELGANSLIQ